MKFGLFSTNMGPCSTPEPAVRVAQAAEAAGFESLWAGEHVVLPEPQVPPSPLPAHYPMLDPTVTFAFIAGQTKTIRMGTGIIILPQRNPLVLAKELASLDVLSRGRLIFGVGIGYLKPEFDALGIPFDNKGPRTIEYVEAMRAIWSQDKPSYQGKFVSFSGVLALPRPTQKSGPPVVFGGSIEVQSTPGVGSTFRFTVCLEQQSQEAPSTPFPLADLHGLRALVIDDNATNRAVLFHYLSAWGMECTCVENGEHGLRALREAHLQAHPYHMAILDFHMPDMDGLEVARAIRADTRLASLPLVLFSSVGLRGEAAQARQAGINAYLTKPVRHSQLYQTLAAMPGRALQKNTPPAPSFVPRHSLTETTAQRRPLLLLVEDNIVNQKLAVRLLEKMGYRADVAANGLEALEAFSRISYAAILMDCLMPEMDGFEATTAIRLREQATGAHVPIIAMTANAMQEDKERCLAVGMDDYIAKPIKPDTLKAIVARWTTMELQDVSPAPSLDETLLG
ncbi:MAG: TIGR03619 family F420-dependent LLM class oxidoreductase [Candidatus Binatia bacterium]